MDPGREVLDFMKSYNLIVVSTVDPYNMPESAVVAFVETPELELIFGTFNDTRKYRNLRANPNISAVIG